MSQEDTLHSLISGFDSLANEAVSGQVDKIRKLLEEGADPNEEDEHDQTPLRILLNESCDPHHLAYLSDVVDLLMARGANPLIKDRAIGKTDGSDFIINMVQILIEREAAGKPMRAEDGSNLLHVLAEDDPATLNFALSEGYTGRPRFTVPTAWIHETRDNGDTPLHAFCAQDAFITMLMEDDQEIEETVAEGAWNSIQLLIEMGANLQARNGAGHSAVNVINNAINRNLFPLPEDSSGTLELIQAEATLQDLETGTGAAPKNPSKPKRI